MKKVFSVIGGVVVFLAVWLWGYITAIVHMAKLAVLNAASKDNSGEGG